MSIIDIEKSKLLTNNVGITKSIDENAVSLILDNVQISQYVYPEASTVRELTSNAIDSQKEKTTAIEILTGKSKIEDYYINRDDSKYKDSNFDISYYNLSNLDKDNNRVKLQYISGKEGVGWCDRFIVTDYGVGLGDRRLEGYFSIGYSTKRNTISQLGGFGIGGKVALSLRNDYFTTETVHNGRLFRFNIYSYKVDNLIGKFNIESGEENPHIVFSDGSIIYYENTSGLNYTKITVPCKTHHKDKIKLAVESQLLYFDNVDFEIIDIVGDSTNKNVLVDVVYNSENLIIADQYQYSKPHIVIVKDKKSSVGVTYGYINFKEMEMQDLFGSVGFKCPIRQVIRDKNGIEQVLQDGVDVTPSRESIIWSDNTRLYVKSVIDKATVEANHIIENQLDEKDFLIWLDKAKNVLGNTGSNRVLRQLVNIIDKTQLSPIYKYDKSIKYTSLKTLFWGFSIRKISKRGYWNHGKYENIIDRVELEDWYYFDISSSFVQIEDSSALKDDFILSSNNLHYFISIKPSYTETLLSCIKPDEIDDSGNIKPNKWNSTYVNNLISIRDKILSLIKSSSKYRSYDDIEVPEDFIKNILKTEAKRVEEEKKRLLTPAEQRKLDKEILCSTHHRRLDFKNSSNNPLTWIKKTIKISDIINESVQTYYSHNEDKLSIGIILLWKKFSQNNMLDPSRIKFFKFSKAIPKKYLKNHKPIEKLFIDETKTFKTMSKELVEWTTARCISENLDKLKFMRNYRLFNQDIAELYKEIVDYRNSNYAEDFRDFTDRCGDKTFLDEFLTYSSKVCEFQLFVRDHINDSESIKNKSTELFGIDTVTNSLGLNLEIYDKLQILLDYAESIGPLFNHIDLLTSIRNPEIPADTENLIKEILISKGLINFKLNKQEETKETI